MQPNQQQRKQLRRGSVAGGQTRQRDILTMQRDMTINVMKDIDKPNHARSIHDAELAVAQKVLPRMQ